MMDQGIRDAAGPVKAGTGSGVGEGAGGGAGAGTPGAADWYKDAIVYQTHVKAFADSNGDGTGDFRGLTERLDYIRDLGVTAVWILPFYPSPQRDDGYDIAEYQAVHPDYGTMEDAQHFIEQAHARGLRVITELIINHTSDQHAWFQRARRAPKGSPEREFYVWSDDDAPYADARIIFTDTETSNWAWDPVAEQYYWHRFFSHQPDLNFDNPAVLEAVLEIMTFWLDLGVDGLRLDAIPYLIEREGTSCENLAETHAVLKRIRAALDEKYADRMLLAEANQWPEDVREYFGDGDECHMAYHFPVMPRMYMAVAQEDRHPIIDIMAQTPDIPDNCQWAIFLRNHDELTLEMVTDRERDFMYGQYAADPRMRINVGIRRRLAPLLDNDTGKIRLMKSLLFSLLGTPVMYYGDEIGMGDNVYLGDRNGVRTPMQWSPDRNGGFSRADPQAMYLPPIMDATYGFEAVNVEAQAKTPASLLNWTRRMITVRKQHPAFGRGTLRFLTPGNRKILAYVRELVADDGTPDVVLCVANLSRNPQPVELDLGEFEFAVPVELSGRTVFPPIGKLPYLLTLSGHGFYWFSLSDEADVPAWHSDALASPQLPVFVIGEGWQTFLANPADNERAAALSQQLDAALRTFLPAQRWFAAKGSVIDEVLVERREVLESSTGGEGSWLLLWLSVGFQGDEGAPARQRYFLPLSVGWDAQADELAATVGTAALARSRQHARIGIVHDAFLDPGFCRELVARIGAEHGGEQGAQLGQGRLQAYRTGAFETLLGGAIDMSDLQVEPAGAPGSNTAMVITREVDGESRRVFLKGYRRLRDGINPELEIGRHLTERSTFERVAPLAGAIQWRDDTTVSALISLQGYTPNQGDAWTWTLDYLERFISDERVGPGDAGSRREARDATEAHAAFLGSIELLGRRTGDMHAGLLDDVDPAFTPGSLSGDELAALGDALRENLHVALQELEAVRAQLDDEAAALAARVVQGRQALLERIADTVTRSATARVITSRVHGDYHLGQVLIDDGDFIIIDFEGEPGRSLEERRARTSALKDVAGMLRSLDYAASSALMRALEFEEGAGARLSRDLGAWRDACVEAFLRGWREAVDAGGAALWPSGAGDALLELYLLDKAVYELRYEISHRPAWVGVPLAGLDRLIGSVANR